MMGKYYFKSYHDVSEDTYQEGLGNFTHHYEMYGIVTADEAIDAIEKYGKEVLGYEFDGYEVQVEDGIIYYDVLVNEDSMQPTDKQVELWKKGEYKLFNDSIIFQIYNMEPLRNLE